MMTEIIIALLGALTGGGLTGLFAWRANRRKAEGEATQAEADAMKSVQDVYQQALADQEKYAAKLRETRDHLANDRDEMRRENNDLRKRLNDMDEKVRQLERDVARNGRMVESLRPFLCGRLNCPNRTKVDLGSEPQHDTPDSAPAEKPAKTARKSSTKK
ncbi:MAG: hypothetical protein IJV55_02570 [Paludibacteraceae bacterium]|nr:hypothetical protein [Paludibacteraceae bacterium]